jgi:hypothetical protein
LSTARADWKESPVSLSVWVAFHHPGKLQRLISAFRGMIQRLVGFWFNTMFFKQLTSNFGYCGWKASLADPSIAIRPKPGDMSQSKSNTASTIGAFDSFNPVSLISFPGYPKMLHIENLHYFVAQVVDYVDGDAAIFELFEGARNVAIQDCPRFGINLSIKGGFTAF